MTKEPQVTISRESGYSRFPFFPVPEHGETVFSLFARAVARTGLPAKYIIEALTGQSRKTSLLSVLPGNMIRIAESVPYGHPWSDIYCMISNHTSFPYFTYFDTREQRDAAWNTMTETNSCIKTNMSLGLTSYRQTVKSPHPRYCVDCLKEDIKLGFTYFRREHQLPAVALCWKHGSILASGCKTCNPFTGHAHGLLMAGRCQCSGGITPADSFCTLPDNRSLLKWFADQSLHMVNSGGIDFNNTRAILKKMFLKNGFGRGSLLDFVKIAREMERKYGTEILNWLGYPSMINSSASPWITHFFRGEDLTIKRSSAITYLLFIGMIYESLEDFEQSISSGGEDENNVHQQSVTNDSEMSSSGSGDCSFAKNLYKLLEEHRFRISTVAAKVGVCPHTVAIEVRKQGIKVPLSSRLLSIHGKEKIDEVRLCLRLGMPKKKIQNHYKVSEWTILLIELDEPGIGKAHKSATSDYLRDSHRSNVLNLIASDIYSSKTDLMKLHPGSYEFMLEKDKQWFDLQFANQAKKEAPKLARKFKERPDSILASKVSSIIEKMLSQNEKPRRITRVGVLKKAGYLNSFLIRREKFPQTELVLNNSVESQPEFLKRKIKWAISEMCKSGQTISVNRLRRVAGVPASKLRERREYVISTATKVGAVINGRSFFVDI